MPTEFSVNKRDIQFVLFEQLHMERLCELPAYRQCDREQFELVLNEAMKIALEVLAPLNASGDREGCQYEKGEVRTPKGFKEAWRRFTEGGWIGMVHDPDVGGQGLPQMLRQACAEIFFGANGGLFLTTILTEGAAHLIDKFGTPELRTRYCEKMYSGQWGGTMCLTESSAGSDVGNLKTTAKRSGDQYLISGSKIFISGGEHDMAENIIHLTLARVEGAPAGTKGISLFVVPKYLVNKDGSLGPRNDLICGNIEHKMGIKSSPTCTINFGDEGRCQGWLLGEENQGMRLMFQMMNEERLGIGVQGLALASVGYLSALGYARERLQGASLANTKVASAPRAPIIEHPDVRRMLIWMKAVVDGMRSMMLAVAQHIDLSEHAATPEERERNLHVVELLTPICKAYASDMGFRVNEMAVQVYGGYGYCQEYPVEQYLRDQKISSIYEGTTGIQAMDLLGRKVIGNNGAYLKEYLGMISSFIRQHSGGSELAALLHQLGDAAALLNDVSLKLGEIMKKDQAYALLHATPYLELFGHVATAYYLLDAAVTANDRLKSIVQKAGATTPQARAAVISQNSEAAFYQGRIASASYFVNNILPQVHVLAEGVRSGDRSALEVSFPE
jgi:alkylation response protein AidB-like acyl-CoA dehydrogenase